MQKENMVHWYKQGLLLLVALLFQQTATQAKVVLPAFFSSNMVLQQKDKVQFFGTAVPGKKLVVVPSWGKKKYTAKTDAQGHWQLTIPTPAAGRGFSITFNDGEELILTNVLVGEVWVASGQSNMEMTLLSKYGNVVNAKQEIAEADYPEIRFLRVDNITSNVPLTEPKITSGGWQVCSPQTVPQLSAVAYFFARKLNMELKVPIGIISASWGGTVAEAWASANALKAMPEFTEKLKSVQKNASNPKSNKELLQAYEQAQKDFQELAISKDEGFQNGQPIWAAPDLPTSSWKALHVPGLWEYQGISGFDGALWLRKTVTVPAYWAGKDLTLSLGPIDDEDITFFNGEQLGTTKGRTRSRTYKIPAHLVRTGKNTITVRVTDQREEGGLHGEPAQLYLAAASAEKIPLAGEWSYKPGIDFADLPPAPPYPVGANQVTVLYNSMIHPFTQLPIRGVIWYQGESNARRAHQYRTLFPLLITDWRKHWGRGDFPFYFVQLANHMKQEEQPAASAWAELREGQLMALQLPNTGMAVTIDIGEEKDIHPKNKQDVGHRLALVALSQTYCKDVIYSGPLYQKMKVEDNQVRLTFKHTEGGLRTKDAKVLKGFSLAGPDRKFYWAEARIEGNEVVVSSPQVPNPVAVRYGWANNPATNLTNASGLPASPFRSDDWPGVTVGSK